MVTTAAPYDATSISTGDCRIAVPEGALGSLDAERIARVFKALGDPTRVRLLSLVATSADPDGICLCDLTEPVNLSQPTVSHHMKQLVEAGLVTREQRGKWAHFHLVEGALGNATHALLPNP